LKEPAFDAALREAKAAIYSQAIARSHQMVNAAMNTLGKIMVDPKAAASARVRAADSILGPATRVVYKGVENTEGRNRAPGQSSQDVKHTSNRENAHDNSRHRFELSDGCSLLDFPPLNPGSPNLFI
jgi:hypothetical protein